MRSPSWDQPRVTLPLPHGAMWGCRGCLAAHKRKAKLPSRCTLAESSADFSPISQYVLCQPGMKERLKAPFLLGINCTDLQGSRHHAVLPGGPSLCSSGGHRPLGSASFSL